MAAQANIGAYSDALVVLGIAGVFVPLLGRLGISPVLGYLGAGALLGPFGLGSLRGELGLFRWLTISDAKGVAGIAELVRGIIMALGAFVAGILLAETEYRKSIEIAIEPFKGVLLGLFFFTVGMRIDFREIINHPLLVFGAIAALVFIKAVLLAGLATLFGAPRGAAIETAFLLGPAGEFAFVGIGLATQLGLLSANLSSFALAVTSLSMAFIPALGAAGRRISYLEKKRRYDPDLLAVPRQCQGHVIVVGHGRVGQVLCSLLERHVFPFIASDKDPDVVSEHRRSGRAVYFGDAANPAFLKSCGIEHAKAVIVTATGRTDIDEIVKAARSVRPNIVIVSRASDAAHASHLYEIGVTDAVPETIEASLQLSEASLVGLGLPAGPVIASIHEMRDEFRTELQNAARRSGKQMTRGIRKKTLRDRLH